MSHSALNPASIVVINVSRIGDTLLATPALRALAARWPRAQLDFLGHPKRFEVVAHLGFVHSVGGITKHRAPWRGWLGAKRWDLAIVYGFDRPLVAYALRAAQRVVAFRQDDARLDARLQPCVEKPGFQSMHSVDHLLTLTRAVGAADASRRLAYVVTDAERAWAKAFLAQRIPAGASPLVGLQVASFPTKAFRDWPLESFAALCGRILDRWPGAHFLFLGGALEATKVSQVASRFPGHATVVAGQLALRQSAALMNELDVYVGVDTGPTHIMGALDRPMVALYHCRSPSHLLIPLERPRLYVVDHPRANGDSSPEASMAEIGVETVWRRVVEALEGE
jgi:heptosyltransferase-3